MIYKLDLTKNGEHFHIESPLTVTMNAPLSDVTEYAVFHIKENNSIESYFPIKQSDGTISFEIRSMGYLIIGKAMPASQISHRLSLFSVVESDGAVSVLKNGQKTVFSSDALQDPTQKDAYSMVLLQGQTATLSTACENENAKFVGWFRVVSEDKEASGTDRLSRVKLEETPISTKTEVTFSYDSLIKSGGQSTYCAVWMAKRTFVVDMDTLLPKNDEGKYVYYTDVNGNFTVNGKIICGPDKESAISSVIYDGNASDALVTYTGTTSDYTVLVNSGKIRDGEKQVGSLTSMVLPDEIMSQDKRFYNVDSFVKTAAGITSGSDEYHYYIANKSGEFKRLFSGVLGMGEIYISTDCKTIYFRKDQQGSIKYMNLSDYNDFPKEYSFDGIEVAHFKMSKNGEYIYFINNEGTLYYKKGRSKAVKICDGVNADEYYVTDSGNVYFGTAYNGTSMELLFSKKGEKYSKVRTGTETVAIHYYEGPNVICFETQNEIYTASSGKGKLVYSK